MPRFGPLVGAFNQTNITITGKGVIDGQGAAWWSGTESKRYNLERPRLVELQHVDGLTISYVTLKDSPFWTVHPIYCNNVHIHHIRITAAGPNTDGIDPDSCSNVLIEDYYYCAGDDAIAVKSGWNYAGIEYGRPSVNITARRCYSGCRGGFTIGSEMSGGVQNVTFEDSVSTGESGIRISSELGRGGYVRDVVFRNISFSWDKTEGKSFLLHVNQDYRPDNPNKTLSYFGNLSFIDLTVTAAPKNFPLGDFTCLQDTPCLNTTFANISTQALDSPSPITCSYVGGTQANVGKSIPATCTAGGSPRPPPRPPRPPSPPGPPQPSQAKAVTCSETDPRQRWVLAEGKYLVSAPSFSSPSPLSSVSSHRGEAARQSAHPLCLDMHKTPPFAVSVWACNHATSTAPLSIPGGAQGRMTPKPQPQLQPTPSLSDDQFWEFDSKSHALLMAGYIVPGEHVPRCLVSAPWRDAVPPMVWSCAF